MENTKKTLLILHDTEIPHYLFLSLKNEYLFYQELAKEYKIILLCLTPNQRNFKQIKLASNLFQISIPSLKNNKLKLSGSKSTVENNTIFKECMKNEYFISIFHSIVKMSDIILFSNPYFFPLLNKKNLVPVIFLFNNNNLNVYCSNIEKQNLYINSAISISDVILVDSINSKKHFLDLNKNIKPESIHFIENNNDIVSDEKISREEKNILKKLFFNQKDKNKNRIVFIGLNDTAFFEAGEYIVTTLSKELSDIEFIIIGPVCEYIIENLIVDISENIILYNEPDEIKKNLLLATCDIAIHPIFQDVSTNATIINYISNNVPIISTKKGVEFLKLKNNLNCIISKRESFKEDILKLLKDKKLIKKISENAYNFYKNNYSSFLQVKNFKKILKIFI